MSADNTPLALAPPTLPVSGEGTSALDRIAGKCSPAGSGTTSAGSVTSTLELPSSSIDGVHLHWKTFRKDVLSPHRISIVETLPPQGLPQSLIALIGASQVDIGKFELQKNSFCDQVTKGRGFGPSPLFPPNLLPSIDSEPKLARCMVPSFDREALPERISNHAGPLYELSLPRSGLGCGFANGGFSDQEIRKMPQYLVATGTVVHFDTGYIAPGALLYCPFMIFERTFGQTEKRLEAANNQCAIAGAWCTRSLQMLYAAAWSPGDKERPDHPTAFSCTIDNDVAILNYHWISSAQSYCMAPVVKFDLSKDEHFKQFNIWIEAIGQWGLRTVLPIVKRSLAVLDQPLPQMAEMPKAKPDLKLDTGLREDKLVTALKTSFDNIPWRLDDEEYTPLCSSVASWGSPIMSEFYYNNLQYPTVPKPRSSTSTTSFTTARSQPTARLNSANPGISVSQQRCADRRLKVSTPLTSAPLSFVQSHSRTGSLAGGLTPPPCYMPDISSDPDTELAWQNRFNQAQDEIQNLHHQLHQLKHEMSGLSTSLQTELSGLKNTLNCVLRKEVFRPSTVLRSPRRRSLSSPPLSPIASGPQTAIPALGSSNTDTTKSLPKPTTSVSMKMSMSMTSTSQTMKEPSSAGLTWCTRPDSHASVITTPTDPRPKSYPWDLPPVKRTRSLLQNVMTINTDIGSTKPVRKELDVKDKIHDEQREAKAPSATESESSSIAFDALISSNNFVKNGLSPATEPKEIPLPGTTGHKPDLTTPGPISSFPIRSDGTKVAGVSPQPPKATDILKWSAALFGAQTIGVFIPSTSLRVLFLGVITDCALLGFASPHWGGTAAYLASCFSSNVTKR